MMHRLGNALIFFLQCASLFINELCTIKTVSKNKIAAICMEGTCFFLTASDLYFWSKKKSYTIVISSISLFDEDIRVISPKKFTCPPRHMA